MTNNRIPGNYTLVICEKPDAARRVAEALGGTESRRVKIDGVETFEVSNSNDEFVVCSALGHLYAVADPFRRRGVFPVFDLEWYPTNLVNKEPGQVGRRIDVIRKLATKAKSFVNACDFDVEGETIGYNVLKYACGGKESVARRAKFSTLTRGELTSAIHEAALGTGEGLARAGRTRHLIDFLWGINLSRALSESIMKGGHRYRTVSIGRVQGPTLYFVAMKEIETKTFVPTPYWSIVGVFRKGREQFQAPHSADKLPRLVEAESIVKETEGKKGVVSDIKRSASREGPPPPFNTGDLQKEAFRVFGLSPSRTLHIAERLYLNALVSYPRTNSQKIPQSLDCRQIIQKIGSMRDYTALCERLLMGRLRPKEGEGNDPAHPSIYPTGEFPKRSLDFWERRLFDMVVRRFLAAFGEDAVTESIVARILVENHEFKLVRRRTVEEGWITYYKPYGGHADRSMPRLIEGDSLEVVSVNNQEKHNSPPERYNQATLLEKMEEDGIGTKATRAETISTLFERGYVSGVDLVATDIGLSVVDTMTRYSPDVLSAELTRRTEERLEKIQLSEENEQAIVEEVMRTISDQTTVLRTREKEIGDEINQSIAATTFDQSLLGSCPVCKVGKLRVIHNFKTRKRFVGCINYSNGCRASAPLPQIGILRPTTMTCKHCGWPVVFIRLRRGPWRLCVNLNCISKSGKRRALSTVQKRSREGRTLPLPLGRQR